MKGGTLRGALFRLLVVGLVALPVAPSLAADSKLVVVEFQPETDDDAGLAYLLYSTVSETVSSEGGGDVVAGEDVEMFLGSAAADCHKKRSCLDKLAERFESAAALMATIARDDLEIAVTYAFISTTTGNVLDQGKRVYQAGDEGELAQLILDKRAEVIEAAEDDAWTAEVDDGGEEVPVEPPPEEYDDRREPEEADEEEGPSRYSAREFERSSSRKSQEEKEARAAAAAAERAERAREREERYAREAEEDDREERDDRYSRDREDRYSRDRDDREDRESRDDRYSRDRDERSSRDREDRSTREAVRVRDLEPEEEEDDARAEKKETRASRKETKAREERENANRARPESTRRERSKKHPEDTPPDEYEVVDRVLLETFDSEDDASFAEDTRSGTNRLTREEAADVGMGAAEYRAYVNSGLTYDGWARKRYDHKGKFHLRFAGFYAIGGLDMYYSVRVVRDNSEVLETYYWQSFGFRSASGGGTFGLGFGVAPAVDLSAEVSLFYGEQWLLREWRTPDGTTSTIGSTADPPKGPVMHFMIEPKTRFYFTPYKPVKPYAGFGFALLFMPPFDVPEDWAPDRPGAFVLGLEPAVGVQFDSPLGVGFFIEAPFTAYVGSDHGVESGLSGEGAYLSDEEKNDPPVPVPRYMLRAQMGIQIRM